MPWLSENQQRITSYYFQKWTNHLEKLAGEPSKQGNLCKMDYKKENSEARRVDLSCVCFIFSFRSLVRHNLPHV